MKLTQVLPAAAVLGLLLATLAAFRSNTKKPASIPVAQPAEAPYTSYIGGSGIIEASNQNISIGTSLAGIVKTVAVKVGDRAKAGQPLFQIDDRELRGFGSHTPISDGLFPVARKLRRSRSSSSREISGHNICICICIGI